ncbi:DUF1566 domain-containing protein [Reinekea marinisedimentorum]|uniref:Uncharacterized protein DUF1566 n=1 Tax=Reinekea marinisedimentorum TaxID=230495 RepID=A0A4R3I807_9GAMM|nr:DUF1566 domain-containing protein [Reinekea marinisedimentorum]TCS41081.1 uncharacterized protein DUF1566 [Reinekea marinisedimentorum]
MDQATKPEIKLGTGMPAKDALGYIDARVAQALTQHAISWDQQVKFIEILDGDAQGDNGKAIEIAREVGLLNDQEAETLAFLLSKTPQLSVDEARALATQLHEKVGYSPAEGGYPIVSCGTKKFYHDSGEFEPGNPPKPDEDFGRQSAYYNQTDLVNQPSYRFFDDDKMIVEDQVTGLMWTSSPFLFGKEKKTFKEAMEGLDEFNARKLGGFNDWRIPTIKELYSLADFSGSFGFEFDTSEPFFDTDFFEMPDSPEVLNPGDRFLDTQTVTSTIYRSQTLGSTTTMFGYNFRDGFLKGYPSVKTFTVFYVRGNTHYGQNMFVDNGDGTVSDLATGLMWMKYDSGTFRTGPTGDGRMDWRSAMNYCENLHFAGHDDWRLPDAKQLHSILDYERCPDVTNSPAIDPLFECTPIVNMAGIQDWSDYWTSTPFCERNESIDMSFGRAMGALGNRSMDVHGAGAQRGDTRSAGNGEVFYPWNGGKHPQGDETYARNMVRAVRVIK